MAEKRALKRYLRRLKVRYGVDKPTKLAFTEDICATGMFIRTYDVIKPGSTIYIEVYLSDDCKVLLKGLVKWIKKLPPAMVGQAKKAGMGVHIVEILSGAEGAWRQFIESCTCHLPASERCAREGCPINTANSPGQK